MVEIISNFYLIRVEGSPVYVGYTNRPIKDRFREHLKDKDFGSGDVTLEGIGELLYTFTWDMSLINQYAREVSDRESELIYQYGTQDSPWQKGIGDSIGGQTWANIKYFVKTNRDNPKFSGMHEGEVLEYLDTSYKVYRYLSGFVSTMNDPVSIYLGHFVANMGDPVSIYMGSFVSSIGDPVSRYLRDFVSSIGDPISRYMKDFVSHMDDPVAIYLGHFVSTMNDPISIYMKSFVSHMDDPVSIYMKNFVLNINDPVAIYVGSFVSNMNDPISIYMKNFVTHMKSP